MASKSINNINKFRVAAFILILNIFMSVFPVIAQETIEHEVTFGDPGTTMPGDFFHPVELLIEDLTGVSKEEQIEERYAEANTLIQEGDYDNAGVALGEAVDSHEALQNELKTLAETTVGTTAEETVNTETSLQQEDSALHNSIETVVETESNIQTLNDQLDAIHTKLIIDVNEEKLTEETAGDIFNDVQEASSETKLTVLEEKEQVETIISSETRVSELEVEIVVLDVEEDKGLHEGFKEDVNHDSINSLEIAIVKIEKEIETLEDTGENTKAAEQVLNVAELHLQRAEDALESNNIGEAHGLFTSAEHLTANVDKFLENPDKNRDELVELVKTPEEIKKELQDEEHIEHARDDNYWIGLITKYPEHADEIKAEQERAKEVDKLFSTTDIEQKINELTALGKPEEEVHELVIDAYAYLYGKEYIPPGTYFTEIKEAEKEILGGISEVATDEKGDIIGGYYKGELIKTTDIKDGGGFIYNHEYTDPSTSNTYEYKLESDGTTSIDYTDVLGQKYTEELLANYNPELKYEKGNEKHTINYESSTGENVVVELSVLGVEFKSTEGKELAKEAYKEGKYPIAGGAEVKIDEAIGYTLENDDGKATVYTYNPEFKNYYDALSGLTYNPDVSSHVDKTTYDAAKGKYNCDYGAKDYLFDPAKNSWTLPDGKSLAVQVATAPIGEEDKEEVKLANGEIWNYDKTKGEWASSTGEKYTPSPNNYVYAKAGESHVDPHTGATWTTTTNEKGETVWTSSTRETWNPATGTHTTSEGSVVKDYGVYHDTAGKEHKTEYNWYEGDHYTQTPGGTYSYYDSAKGSSTYTQSGQTWTLNPTTGIWTSSTGGSFSTEGHADAYGHVGPYEGTTSGTYGGTTTGTYDAGHTGSYESYSTTTSGGTTTSSGGTTSTGGDTGGSAPSGGGHTGGHVILGIKESPLTGKIIQDNRLYRRF
ncbi:MAG: hypothetical protein AABW90_02580 [Nanoarchaeota archaeon]